MFQERSTAAYVTLDDAFQLAQARNDPATFVAQGPSPLIIDEVQRGGDDLIRAIKIMVDQRQDRGQFILSGSARFLTVPTLLELLAGRAGFIDLWPLSLAERTGASADSLTGFSQTLPACLTAAGLGGRGTTTSA